MAMNSEIEKLERRWQDNPLGLTFAPLAEAYRKAGDTARALELLDSGLAQHPNYVPAHIVRGRCHLDTGAYGEAELAFHRVAELDPENAIALKELAELAERDGRVAEAIARVETLLEVDRNNDEARAQLERLRESVLPPPAPGAEALRAHETAERDPSAVGEIQRSDDTLSLLMSEDRMPEIVLHAEELENALPVPEAAQGREMLEQPDPLAARGSETLLEELLSVPAPEASSEAELHSPVSAPWESHDAPGPQERDEPEYEPELAAKQESQVVREPDPVAEVAASAAAEPEPAGEVDSETAGSPIEVELMVTETMAEIFLRQGHRELALAVYSQLAQREPGNERVAAACAQLQGELAPPPAPPPPAEAPRRFDAAATGGRSVAELFARLLAAERPAAAPAIHPPAFEAPRRPTGEPTRPAPESLSLSAVFGEEAGPAAPAGAAAELDSAEPSFEQFFTPADGATSEIELPKSPDQEATAMSAMAPEDLEQFNAWLRGLKR